MNHIPNAASDDTITIPDEDAPEAKPVGYRWLVFAILSSVYLLVYFHRQAPAVLALDFMKDLGLDGAALGLISAAYFLPYAVFQAPAGAFVGVWGPRKLLCLSLCLAAAGSFAFAVAPGFSAALVGRAMVGFGVSAVLVCILEILAKWFTQGAFLRILGMLLGMGGLGVFAGAAPLAYLDAALGWRASFKIIALISFAIAMGLWFLVRSDPVSMGYPPPDRRTAAKPEQKRPGFFASLRKTAASPGFWPPALWGFMALGIFISLGGLWGGPYLVHVHGLSKLEAGHILAMLAVGMVIGGPLLAFLAETSLGSRKRVLVLACLVLLGLAALLALDPLMPVPLLYAWFGLLGLTTMGAAPLAISLSRDAVDPSLSAPATGLCNFFLLMGGAVVQPLTGWLLDAGSGGDVYSAVHYRQTFYLYLVLAVLALAFALAIKEPGGKPKR